MSTQNTTVKVDAVPSPVSYDNLGSSHWLAFAWIFGATVYGWLSAGLLNERDYPNLTLSSALGISDLGFALVCGVVAGVAAWCLRGKKTSNSDSNGLFRIVVAVFPALFVVSAIAALVLTLATYNGDWVEARQGLATVFAALIAAVGVVVSVIVSYQTGEENRLAQQENLSRQLKHQRKIEGERAQREQNKQDAEIIKSLNDRLHEILSRRYSKDENERSASYFQLATLYQDWETLAASSEIVSKQKNSQQKNILKILFGIPQKKDRELVSERTELEVRTLNSVIQDIFPVFSDGQVQTSTSYDLSHLDLSGLDFSGRNLQGTKFFGAFLVETTFKGANLREVDLERANMGDALLHSTHLEEANLCETNLEGATLSLVRLKGVKVFSVAEKLLLNPIPEEELINFSARVTEQLKVCSELSMPSELQQIDDFTFELAQHVYTAHTTWKQENTS